MAILHKQGEIVSEFAAIPEWEERYRKIIEAGRTLPDLPDEHRKEENKVRGCSSTVWLVADLVDDRVRYRADSDALIVRGLIALILRVYDDERPKDIVAADPMFIEEIGLNTHLSSNRANGLSAMVKQVKAYALGYMAKERRA